MRGDNIYILLPFYKNQMISDKFLIPTVVGSFVTLIVATLLGAIADCADVLGIGTLYLSVVTGIFCCIDFTPPLCCLDPILCPIEGCILIFLTIWFLFNSWFWTLAGTPFFAFFGVTSGAVGGRYAAITMSSLPHQTVRTALSSTSIVTFLEGITGSVIGAFIGVCTGLWNLIWAFPIGWFPLSFIVDLPVGCCFGFLTGATSGFFSSIASLISELLFLM
jgi:hypothetical protein